MYGPLHGCGPQTQEALDACGGRRYPGLPAANHSDISGNLEEPTSVLRRPRPDTRLRVCVRAAQGLYRSRDHHFQTDTRTDRHTDTETAKVCERSERERQRVRVLERESGRVSE